MSYLLFERFADEYVPCYNCTKRTEACHAKCEEYKEYKLRHDAARNVARQSKLKESTLNAFAIEGRLKNRKRND